MALTTHDLAGFLGICTATGFVYLTLTGGGLRRLLREWRLRIERRVLEARLRRMRDRRGLRIVKPDDDEPPRGPWVN